MVNLSGDNGVPCWALEFRATYEPGGVGGRVAFVVDEGEPAVDVFQFHENHWSGAVVATAGYESFAVGVHYHEHAASLVGDDFAVVAGAVQYGIGAFGGENGLGLCPSGQELARGAQAKGVLVVVEMVL